MSTDVPHRGRPAKRAKREPQAAAGSVSVNAGRKKADIRTHCPYLDTIDRHLCDFDLAKQCSISLKKQNVYMCLVCGSIFQGRGKKTHAYTHSVHMSHHVYVNLNTHKFYCLPDNYEILDKSLADIKRALYPEYNKGAIVRIDKNSKLSKDVFGVSYLPGYIGLNNLRHTDFVNVVVQALVHVTPIRDFFLEPLNYASCTDRLVIQFGNLVRKIWSPDSFKNTVAPHEFMNAVTSASDKRFVVGTQSLAAEFLVWILRALHNGLCGHKDGDRISRKKRRKMERDSVIYRTFRGVVNVVTMPLVVKKNKEDRDVYARNKQDDNEEEDEEQTKRTEEDVPFLFLGVDLPPMPLFKDTEGGNIIPQVPLFTVLQKFGGERPTDFVLRKLRCFYRLSKLPPYLILVLNRFTKNNFFTEKNSTIVNFPIKNLEMKDYLAELTEQNLPTPEELRQLPVNG